VHSDPGEVAGATESANSIGTAASAEDSGGDLVDSDLRAADHIVTESSTAGQGTAAEQAQSQAEDGRPSDDTPDEVHAGVAKDGTSEE
jgi:hypothetical protein